MAYLKALASLCLMVGVASLLVVGGCGVSQSDYDAQAAELQQTRSDLAAEQAKTAGLVEQLSAAQKDRDARAAQLTQAQEAAEKAQGEASEMTAELTAAKQASTAAGEQLKSAQVELATKVQALGAANATMESLKKQVAQLEEKLLQMTSIPSAGPSSTLPAE